MARIDFTACTAQELHDLARATYAMHSDDIGVVLLGDNFTLFDLRAEGAEVNLARAHTSPERLLAHARGFVAARA